MIPAAGIKDQELPIAAKWSGVTHPTVAWRGYLRALMGRDRQPLLGSTGAVRCTEAANRHAVDGQTQLAALPPLPLLSTFSRHLMDHPRRRDFLPALRAIRFRAVDRIFCFVFNSAAAGDRSTTRPDTLDSGRGNFRFYTFCGFRFGDTSRRLSRAQIQVLFGHERNSCRSEEHT